MSHHLLKLLITSSLICLLGDSNLLADDLFNSTRIEKQSALTNKSEANLIAVPSTIPFFGSQIATNLLIIARQITVRVSTNTGTGSGVIIGRRGYTYTVLTNKHVTSNIVTHKYSVLTSDGLAHQAKRIYLNQEFANLDLAIIQFTSFQNYRVAKVGKVENLLVGQDVYAAGFPNWYWLNQKTPISTRDWGLKAFKVTSGTVANVLNRPLRQGYRLGYTNEIKSGMSGGPIIDNQGVLVGINGRLKHPFNGISSYLFTDGTRPSQKQFEQMESLSWGISSISFRQVANLVNKF